MKFSVLLLAACAACAQAPGLEGTRWQLVKFQGGDGKVLTPDDKAKYVVEFMPDGRLAARIDCNRGRGMWESSGPNQLQFGALALTRAMCPPGSLQDRMLKDWTFVRSYVIKDGHLFLSLMADGGIYEFEPAEPQSPVASTGPITYECGTETLSATFYQTQPGLLLIERGGQTRPAFEVPAAGGTKYEGDGVMFWEARAEASVSWSGVELKCKRR